MDFLIDTHVLIWYLDGDRRLPNKIRRLLNEPANNVSVSVASLWELTIKLSLKKIDTNITLEEIQADIMKRDFILLQISFGHLKTLTSIAHHHGDPFDRLIISQAITEGLTILSADRQFDNYPVDIIW